jgi:hypothetical protein
MALSKALKSEQHDGEAFITKKKTHVNDADITTSQVPSESQVGNSGRKSRRLSCRLPQ